MDNIKLVIQYDGTNYHGWQMQPNGVTVQETIQKRLTTITGEKATLIGAGRTDAGVHAIAQVAAFRTGSKLMPDVFQRALNASLPDDIRVTSAEEEEAHFHPRYHAVRKTYLYLISLTPTTSPFLYKYVWRLPYDLNVETMRSSLQFLRGSHDFSSFRASGCEAKSPVRTVYAAGILEMDGLDFLSLRLQGRFLKLTIEADSFLRHMVRNIAGTVVEVGRGRRDPEDMRKIMDLKDRRAAGPAAPPRGLFLEKVAY